MNAEAVHRAGRAAEHATGRPRDPTIDRAILDAAIELLVERGYEDLSMEAIAARARVGKPTIYRRWTSKCDLVIDAIQDLGGRVPIPAEGTVRERLTAFVQDFYGSAEDEPSARVFSAVIGEIQRNPELAEAVRAVFVSGRRKRMSALLREGVARGEIRPDADLDLVMDLLFGPLLLRRLVTSRPVNRPLGRKVVEAVLEGIG
jgi:AcrR family transcriptional regulator